MGDLDYNLASFIAKMNMKDMIFNFYNKSLLYISMSSIFISIFILTVCFILTFITNNSIYMIYCSIINILICLLVIIHQVILDKLYEKAKKYSNDIEAYIDYLNGKEISDEIQERTKIIQGK